MNKYVKTPHDPHRSFVFHRPIRAGEVRDLYLTSDPNHPRRLPRGQRKIQIDYDLTKNNTIL